MVTKGDHQRHTRVDVNKMNHEAAIASLKQCVFNSWQLCESQKPDARYFCNRLQFICRQSPNQCRHTQSKVFLLRYACRKNLM